MPPHVPDYPNWRHVRTITLSGYTGDAQDPVATQVPPDDFLRVPSTNHSGGHSTVTQVKLMMVLRDGDGAPVAPGSMAFDFTPIEVLQHDGEVFVAGGASETGAAPYEPHTVPGTGGSTPGGGVTWYLTSVANVPGAAVTAEILMGEL